MNDPVTFDEYTVYANSFGIYGNFEIRMQYKLYLALITDDLEIIKHAVNEYYYNYLYRINGELN